MSQARGKNREQEDGLELSIKVESGKALLECRLQPGWNTEVSAEGDSNEKLSLPEAEQGQWEVCILDRDNRLVFRAIKPLGQEEPVRGILLHPQLWQGLENPYLYHIRAALKQREQIVDVLEKVFAIRSFYEIPMKGWLLNEKPFEIRAVSYMLSDLQPNAVLGESPALRKADMKKSRICRDMERIREMGANTLCLVEEDVCREEYEALRKSCDEIGLLLWQQEEFPEETCVAYEALVVSGTDIPTDSFYYYKGKWSKEPFVYISLESLELQPNGNGRVTVYSNAKRVALYVDGVLFEFRTDGPDFVFEEIPVKHLPLVLSAEIRECSMSVCAFPIHKTFTE